MHQNPDIIINDTDQIHDTEEFCNLRFEPEIFRQNNDISERIVDTVMIQENIDEENAILETSNQRLNLDLIRRKSENIKRNTG